MAGRLILVGGPNDPEGAFCQQWTRSHILDLSGIEQDVASNLMAGRLILVGGPNDWLDLRLQSIYNPTNIIILPFQRSKA